jgi:hypothetical protein
MIREMHNPNKYLCIVRCVVKTNHLRTVIVLLISESEMFASLVIHYAPKEQTGQELLIGNTYNAQKCLNIPVLHNHAMNEAKRSSKSDLPPAPWCIRIF